MRTTIDINDALLAAAKSYAVRNQKTLDAVVEQALRELVSDSSRKRPDAPPIPVSSGLGVQKGVDLADSSALEDLMNARS